MPLSHPGGARHQAQQVGATNGAIVQTRAPRQAADVSVHGSVQRRIEGMHVVAVCWAPAAAAAALQRERVSPGQSHWMDWYTHWLFQILDRCGGRNVLDQWTFNISGL